MPSFDLAGAVQDRRAAPVRRAPTAAAGASHPRTCIVAGGGSRVHGGRELRRPRRRGIVLTNAVTEIALGDRRDRATTTAAARRRDGVSRRARRRPRHATAVYRTSHRRSAARSSRNEIDVALDGARAPTARSTACTARRRPQQPIDTHTPHRSCRRRTARSQAVYRGIARRARARGVFNGKILVRPGAQKTDACQMSRNLLLSDRAEIDTKPRARDLRRRREVQPRRDGRPARRRRSSSTCARAGSTDGRGPRRC